jgi:hypothetical protein
MLALAGRALASGSAAELGVTKVCPTFAGPPWVFTTTKGTKYSLETSGGYSCALATGWVKKLASRSLPSAKQNTHYTIVGPVGFTCEASPDIKRHAFTGSCEKLVKQGAEKLGFVWTSSFI